MAFSGMGPNGGTGRGRWRGTSAISEMNIVPMVDVVLVLLVIFMITASTMEFGLDIKAPEVKKVVTTTEDLPVVNLARDGTTYLGERKVNINSIGKEVKARFKDAKEVYINADKATPWNAVAQVMFVVGESGLGIKAVLHPVAYKPN